MSFDTSHPIADRRRQPMAKQRQRAAPADGRHVAGSRRRAVDRAAGAARRQPAAVAAAPAAAPLASPAVRRRARELHVDLQHVHGCGPNGRITHGDVDVLLRTEVRPAPSHRAARPARTRPKSRWSACGAASPRRWSSATTQIPHFTYIEEVDITELESLREHLNGNRTDGQPKLTYLPFIMLVGDAGRWAAFRSSTPTTTRSAK